MNKPEQKTVTSMSPMEGIISTFLMMADFNRSRRNDVINDKVGDIEVDTCTAPDTDAWETGVKVGDGEWIIVTQYTNRQEAEAEHKKWVAYMKENPKAELKDINLWGIPD